MCRAGCTPEQKSLTTSQTDQKCPENTLGSAGVYLSILSTAPSVDRRCFRFSSVLVN